MNPLWLWLGFNLFILLMLLLDLGVFHKHSHEVTVREAALWSLVWFGLAMLFGAAVWLWQGPVVGMQYLTGYVIEKALSVDNIFVFVLIFSFFKVPKAYQHRVLFWGVLGALIMRAALISVGAQLVSQYEWIMYLFGAFLVYTGLRMAFGTSQSVDPSENMAVRLVRNILPVTEGYEQDRFFVRGAAGLMATPLFLVLVMVEASDLVFAVDSIPAIFAVTNDPFIVFTSNVFAILGLRSLYFLLAGIMDRFRYLKLGLAVVLTFVGTKMLGLAFDLHVPTPWSLGVILAVLTVAIGASLWPRQRAAKPPNTTSM